MSTFETADSTAPATVKIVAGPTGDILLTGGAKTADSTAPATVKIVAGPTGDILLTGGAKIKGRHGVIEGREEGRVVFRSGIYELDFDSLEIGHGVTIEPSARLVLTR